MTYRQYGLPTAQVAVGTIRSFEYEVTTAPVDPLVVTPAELRAYMGDIDETDLTDSEATALILAAQLQIEAYTKITLLKTVFTTKRNVFEPRLKLGRWPLFDGAIGSINYLTEGVDTLVDSTVYKLIRRSFDGYIGLKADQCWPYPVDCEDDAITIVFSAGYPDAVSVPQNLKMAIMSVANWMYSTKGDCDSCNGDFSVSQICTAKTLLIGVKKLAV